MGLLKLAAPDGDASARPKRDLGISDRVGQLPKPRRGRGHAHEVRSLELHLRELREHRGLVGRG